MANLFVSPLPFPAKTYDEKYFNETIKTLNLFFRLVQAAPPGYFLRHNGAAVTPRTFVDFTGAGVTVTDDGEIITVDIGGGGGGGGYSTVQDEGIALTARSTIDFVGAGVSATDSGTKTIVTIPGASSGYTTVEDEGSSLTARSTINFVGAGVTATDAGGKTVVTIPGGGGGGGILIDEVIAMQVLL